MEITAAGMEEEKVTPVRRPMNTFAAANTQVIRAPSTSPRQVISAGLSDAAPA